MSKTSKFETSMEIISYNDLKNQIKEELKEEATSERLDIEQQEPLLKILRLWKTKMLAIRINGNTVEMLSFSLKAC